MKFDAEGFAVSEPLVRMQLKALAAQRLFGTGAYFRVINPAACPAYARAVAILEDWDKWGQPVLEPYNSPASFWKFTFFCVYS